MRRRGRAAEFVFRVLMVASLAFVMTAMSAIVESSVSPERWLITAV